jgi:hypothetical protein
LVFSIHRKMSKAVQTANHNFPTAELWWVPRSLL